MVKLLKHVDRSMTRTRDEETGEFTAQVTTSDTLAALRAHTEPVATAGDLTETLDVSAETVRRHLTTLQERGDVARKEVGARAVVWWAIDSDRDDAPAAPLQNLVGLVDEETADRARERSEDWRESFDDEVGTTDA